MFESTCPVTGGLVPTSARLWYHPPATCETFVNPAGTWFCPKSTLVSEPPPAPHATTVPSLFTARLCQLPDAMATTLLKPVGTLVCPYVFRPHATTVPSDLSA